MRHRRRLLSGMLFLAGFAALSGGCSGDDGSDERTITIAVDPAMALHQGELEGFEGNTPRPIAGARDEEGQVTEFVENELLLITDSQRELDDFIARTGGVLLDSRESVSPEDQIKGIHLIKVSLPEAKAETLVAELKTLDSEARGALTLSSQKGLDLFAFATKERRAGAQVGINWVGKGSAPDYLNRETLEAAQGPQGYGPNSFLWNFFNQGSTHDIGVAEAWRALFLSGRMENKVKVAVIDMGFEPTKDFPDGWKAISIVPGKQPTGSKNTWGCGSSACPWHGTGVSSILAAQPGDGFGAAGVAGPVVDLLMIYSGYDYYSATVALLVARSEGAKIINMSFSAKVPTIVAWTIYPFEWACMDAWDHDHLLFAAAGNDGENVDAEYKDAFGTSWGEKAWHTPCENNDVICVGGIGWVSKERDPGSNYGNEHVDLWAPYNVWVGPTPSDPDNRAYQTQGTSLSSPFAAGVAALIWAADPSLSNSQVRSILYNTAHESPDSKVNRYVNAYEAVMSVLDEQDPFIKITAPPEGSTWHGGHPITFTAVAGDLEDGVPEILWTDSLDGILGEGLAVQRESMSYGEHTTTATAFDLGGNMVSVTVDYSVTNTPPEAEIVEPATASQFFSGETVTFRGSAYDVNAYPGFALGDEDLSWASDRDGALGSGRELSVDTLSVGAHTITLTATDDDGAQDTATIDLTVAPPPPDLPPTVSILSPSADVVPNGPDWTDWQYDGVDTVVGRPYKDVSFIGGALDPEDGSLSGGSLVWTTDRVDLQDAHLGTGKVVTLRLYGEACGADHRVTLTATDSFGNVRTAVRIIRLWAVC